MSGSLPLLQGTTGGTSGLVHDLEEAFRRHSAGARGEDQQTIRHQQFHGRTRQTRIGVQSRFHFRLGFGKGGRIDDDDIEFLLFAEKLLHGLEGVRGDFAVAAGGDGGNGAIPFKILPDSLDGMTVDILADDLRRPSGRGIKGEAAGIGKNIQDPFATTQAGDPEAIGPFAGWKLGTAAGVVVA